MFGVPWVRFRAIGVFGVPWAIMVLCLGCWDNGNNTLVVLSLVEVNSTVNECIESVVLALSYTSTCEVLIATLANDDVACDNALAAENLNTKSL